MSLYRCMFEIHDPFDGHVVQRVTGMTKETREKLERRGYRVVTQSLNTHVWPFLLEDEPED